MSKEEYESLERQETEEWLEAFDEVVRVHGRNRASKLLSELNSRSKTEVRTTCTICGNVSKITYMPHSCSWGAMLAPFGIKMAAG